MLDIQFDIVDILHTLDGVAGGVGREGQRGPVRATERRTIDPIGQEDSVRHRQGGLAMFQMDIVFGLIPHRQGVGTTCTHIRHCYRQGRGVHRHQQMTGLRRATILIGDRKGIYARLCNRDASRGIACTPQVGERAIGGQRHHRVRTQCRESRDHRRRIWVDLQGQRHDTVAAKSIGQRVYIFTRLRKRVAVPEVAVAG